MLALIDALTDPDPTRRPRGPEIAARLAALADRAPVRPSEPFPPLETVGRDAELAELSAALAASAAGPVLVRIRGAAGYGKTALLSRFASDARASGALVLSARSYEHAQVPYKALDELIDELAAALARAPTTSPAPADLAAEDRLALARIFPVLGTPSARAAPADIEPAELRRRAARAFPRILAGLAADRPLVILLDDLHWGDDDSLPLLAEVLRSRVRVLIVAAFRGDDQGSHRLPAALADAARATIDLELGPLSEAATATLIRAAAPALSPDGAVAAAAESRGVPLFAAELARAAAHRNGLAGSLDDVVRDRVAALAPTARTLLSTIAVAGAPVEESVAAHAARSTATDLHALVAGRLVRSRAGRAAAELAIYHDRIRERIVDDLAPAERTHLHGALADALATAADPDVERLAFHLRGAGRAHDAIPHLRAAADRAAAALAFERAAALYAEVLALTARAHPSDPAIAALHERRGDLLAAAGHPVASADAYLAAANAPAARTAEPMARHELLRRASEQLLRGGHFDRGMAVAEELLGVAGLTLPASPLRALPGLVLGRLALLRDTRRLAADGSDAASSEPRQVRADTDLARQRFAIDVAWTLSSGLALVDPLRAAHVHGQGAQRALVAGTPVQRARILIGEATFSGMRGTRGAARTAELTMSARRLADVSGDPYVATLARTIDGMAAVQEGRMRPGEAGCREALARFRAGRGGAWERAICSHFRAFALTYLGDIDELQRFVTETLADAEARGDLHLATDQRTAYANLVWLLDGGPAAARRQVERAMSAWSRGGYHAQHYYAMQALTHIALWEHDGPRALAIVDDAWPALRRSLLLLVQGMRIDALWLRARALLAAAEHARGLSRRRLLDRAATDARSLDRTRAPWAIALAAVTRARIADISSTPATSVWATARARCAAADLRGHASIERIWPVPR